MGKPRTRQKSSLGILFWIAAILLVSIVLMFSLPSIREVLETTEFVEVVFDGAPPPAGDTPSPDTVERDRPVPDTIDTDETAPRESDDRHEPIEEERPAEEIVEDDGDETDTDAHVDKEEREELDLVQRSDEAEADHQERTMRTTIYLIRITDSGRILAEGVPRTIEFTRSPLTKTVEALLAGPDGDDHNRGLLSLIPSGSRLLGARIENGVAYLNFSEEFRFNDLGMEGHLAQLQQIVLTATHFSTVDSVQILLDGQQVDYLGGDGVYVGRPLTATDFHG